MIYCHRLFRLIGIVGQLGRRSAAINATNALDAPLLMECRTLVATRSIRQKLRIIVTVSVAPGLLTIQSHILTKTCSLFIFLVDTS